VYSHDGRDNKSHSPLAADSPLHFAVNPLRILKTLPADQLPSMDSPQSVHVGR